MRFSKDKSTILHLGCDTGRGLSTWRAAPHGCFDNIVPSVCVRGMDTEFLVLLCKYQEPLRDYLKYKLVFEILKWQLRFHHTNNSQRTAVLERNTKSSATMSFQISSVLCSLRQERSQWNQFQPSTVKLSASFFAV